MVQFGGSLVVLGVSLLIGGMAIYLGAALALEKRSYGHAVVTAVMGAVTWWLLGLGLADLQVPSGPIASGLALVVWVSVLKYRYHTGWVKAGVLGLFAWAAALAVLAALATVGVTGVRPFGVP